jgi:hypothetical protein
MVSFFKSSYDGGKDSGVTGFWLIECKWLFSIVILKFNKGTREAYHTHAFNALTWWLWGSVIEHVIGSRNEIELEINDEKPEKIKWWPSLFPKYTPREHLHMIEALEPSYAISFIGPW